MQESTSADSFVPPAFSALALLGFLAAFLFVGMTLQARLKTV
jgi:hypothetical protein